jgi:hypothetical protein
MKEEGRGEREREGRIVSEGWYPRKTKILATPLRVRMRS